MDIVAVWSEWSAHPDFWAVISIPLVAAIVTWVHVWMAMQLLFWPLEFMGKPPWLGWQGIVPRKARKMARIVARNSLTQLGSAKEFFSELGPRAIAEHAALAMMARADDFTDEIMRGENPVLWENLPLFIRRQIHAHVKRSIPGIMDSLLSQVHAQIDELVDIDALIVKLLETDKALLVRMFKEVGRKEIAFVVHVSFWIGLLCGGIQMVLWCYFPWGWSLPLFAAVLGLATNWLALNLVFRPLHPIQVGPWRIQGLFLKRQDAVVDRYAHLATTEILTIKHFSEEIFAGSGAAKSLLLVKKAVAPLLDDVLLKTAAQFSMGLFGYAQLRSAVATQVAQAIIVPLSEPAFNEERARQLEAILARRMKALDAADFQALLRPAFQEDEWVFLVLGAVTGLLAGGVQWMMGFH